MKAYRIEVRLGSNLLQTVPLSGVSAQRIRILRTIHGDDAVVSIKESGRLDWTEDEELKYLAADYGRRKVETVFSCVLDGFDAWLEAKQSDGDSPAPVPATEAPGLALTAPEFAERPIGKRAEKSA
jgi:hypothetical protein